MLNITISMKILVTGGLGFIGSNFIRYIINNDKYDKIINIDKLSYGSNPSNLKDITDDKYSLIIGDIADSELVSRYMKDINVIINFAAESHVDRSIANPDPFINSNIIGCYKLLEEARKNNIKLFMHISTDEVYGDAYDRDAFKEEDRLNPSSPYSASKAAAEHLVSSYARTYGLKTMIVRCTNNFGPYQFPEKLIPKTIIRALKGLKIPLYAGGYQRRSWIYVLDFCNAIDFLLDKGKINEVYNVTAYNELTNRDVVMKILSMLNKDDSMIEEVEDRPGHDKRYAVDASKISALGWKPRYKFDEALEETVNWYIKNRWWWEPLINEQVLHPTPWKLKW